MNHFGEISGKTIKISMHALERMVEMKVTPEQVRAVLETPEETYQSTKYSGSICYRTGELTLATVEEDGVVIVKTALYGTATAWLKAWKEGKLPSDRHIDDLPKKLPRW